MRPIVRSNFVPLSMAFLLFAPSPNAFAGIYIATLSGTIESGTFTPNGGSAIELAGRDFLATAVITDLVDYYQAPLTASDTAGVFTSDFANISFGGGVEMKFAKDELGVLIYNDPDPSQLAFQAGFVLSPKSLPMDGSISGIAYLGREVSAPFNPNLLADQFYDSFLYAFSWSPPIVNDAGDQLNVVLSLNGAAGAPGSVIPRTSFRVSAIPEPGSLAMLCLANAGIFMRRRRRFHVVQTAGKQNHH